MTAPKRMTPNTAYRAMRYLADRIYEIDKENDFDIPTKKTLLLRYAEQLRHLIDEAIRIAKEPVMRPIDFKKRIRKKKDEQNEEQE